ncbi:ankyrin repeat protein [Metarhizium robertsii]|uniref:Ankyrin repeat protein n=2 Tax=Metarhizium robertsii TaxID=568076 RepID=E9FE09_METRA|nr:Ankyrin repeat protein [Metarhizium robertsii ARSEF 23]EFY94031.1 Ankyrin repeat protein [Metarhizium robertsii ARSEF 23]EXU95643.1 ankyrin repeat protein [Metarhizium robertsii]
MTTQQLVQQRMREAFGSPNEAIHACIRDNNISQLQQLVISCPSADLEYLNHAWGAPLHVAVWSANLSAVDVLLDAGADVLAETADDSLSATPLGLAARLGLVDILRRLWISVPPESHANVFRPPLSCLILAATYGQAATVGHLLDWWDGWSLDVRDTALCYASGRWQVHSVQVLLERLRFSHETMVRALHKAADFKFIMAEEEGALGVQYSEMDYVHQRQLIAKLVDAGADVNARLHGQHLTLQAAGVIDLAPALSQLLESGLDPGAKSGNDADQEQSALHLLGSPVRLHPRRATCRLHESGIRLLLQHGASVFQRDALGNTPLHCAAFGSNLRIFSLYLSSAGSTADMAVENDHGETLLHWAAAGGKTDILEYLLSHGADVNAASANGWTPLMCALAPSRESRLVGAQAKELSAAIRAAQLLLSSGATPFFVTAEGWTPLHCLALHLDHDEDGQARLLAEQLILAGGSGRVVDARAPMLLSDRRPNRGYAPRAALTSSHIGLGDASALWGFRVEEAIRLADTHPVLTVKRDLTPLHWAAEHGAVGVAKALLTHGANILSEDPFGNTPAMTATASKLLERRPDVREKLIQVLGHHAEDNI